MTDPPAANEIARLLAALARAERQFARAVAADMSLAPTDLYALGDLLAEGSAGVTDLGRRIGLGSAAATGLADRLAAAGYVARTPHPTDRRRLVLTPTDHAREELFAHLRAISSCLAKLGAELSEDEQATVRRFLETVISVYNEHASP